MISFILCLVTSDTVLNNQYTPSEFKNAWNHHHCASKIKWRESIKKELDNINRRSVWSIIDKKDLPENKKTLGLKWVFKIKSNGVFKERLVAQGFLQRSGVDYFDSYSPVMSDVTMRLLLVYGLKMNLSISKLDIEASFLEGEVKEELYINFPNGMEFIDNVYKGKIARLNRAIYGLVQASRQFFKEVNTYLQDEMGMNRCIIEPCLLCDKENELFICLYVDDILIIGKEEKVTKFRNDLKKRFNVTFEDSISEFLGCDMKIDRSMKELVIHQDSIIKTIKTYFGSEVNKMREYQTPGEPNSHVKSPVDQEKCLSKTQQNKYQSGVGSLMYLCKHSRPDLTKNVRDLSRCMKMADSENYKSLLRTIKYVLDTSDIGLRIGPIDGDIDEFKLECFSDSVGVEIQMEEKVSQDGLFTYVDPLLVGVPNLNKVCQHHPLWLNTLQFPISVKKLCL